MKLGLMCSLAAGAMLIVAQAAVAQDRMAQDKMAKPMDMKEMSHTGCLAAGSMSGSYKLSNVEMMGKGHTMMDGAAAHEGARPAGGTYPTGGTRPTEGVRPTEGAMSKDGAMAHDMKKDGMMEMTVMSKTVDLSKHVGHRVTLTGMADKAMTKDSMGKETHTFTVSSLKMVSATCAK